jgi:NhaA family Na+:H+ antiporter
MSPDIAFALGILALFGRRVPLSLKVFLTALAIADDMGAVLVIALFYTAQIYWGGLLVALIFLGLMFGVSQMRIRSPAIYILLAIVVWLGVLFSGVHATVAGILIALVVPSRSRIDPEKFLEVGYAKLEALQKGPALTKETLITDHERFEATHDLYEAASDLAPVSVRLEHSLHPTTAYFILPLFALFNAGVPLDERIFASLADPVSLGLIFGLVLGKQIGVTLFSWLVVRSGQARLPAGVTWGQLYGVSWLAGVGFTMALFVSELAFINETLIEHAKVGILAASLIAAVLGYLILNQLLPGGQPLADQEADAHSRPQSV